jgi:anti-sigma regulatory factor (Ser/Thr protein kinase)
MELARMARNTELIKKLLIEEISADDVSPVAKIAEQMGVSRQAVDKQLRNLIDQGIVLMDGTGRASRYTLPVLAEHRRLYRLADGLAEHDIFRDVIVPALAGLGQEDLGVVAFGFNEMLNNAIEHSQAKEVMVAAVRTANALTLQIVDDGLGVFKKLADTFRFSSLPEALFEVSKGKLTTEPARHNGEGIFFTARMFDAFMISANGLSLMHNANVENGWLAAVESQEKKGTRISLVLNLPTTRNMQQVFDDHVASQGDFGFTKTHVLLKLAQFGEKLLVSRSHARRVALRFERFREVVLDFEGVDLLGPAFADELLRVFPSKKPHIKLSLINVNDKVERSIAACRI